jgi:hypothetical protein
MTRVTCGKLPKHARLDFAKWAPVRPQALMQAFADFLVACEKDKNGGFHLPCL